MQAKSQTQMLLAAFKGFLHQQGADNLQPLQDLLDNLQTKPARKSKKKAVAVTSATAFAPVIRMWNHQVYKVCPQESRKEALRSWQLQAGPQGFV